jgi:hypothetical protein
MRDLQERAFSFCSDLGLQRPEEEDGKIPAGVFPGNQWVADDDCGVELMQFDV